MARLVIALAALFIFAAPAFAEKRVALVIGNSAYAKAGRLPNPANDAKAIAVLLRRAGFEISEARLDLGLAAFKRALSDFEVSSKGADIAAFYFSGHGVQINNQDYLLPVDAELARDVDAQDEAVTLDRVLRATEGALRLRLVIIDACRDNPFVARMKNVVATRSLARGLAPPAVELADTLIAFAARDGTQAIDGAPGANSPFAAAILRRLAEPGLDVQLAFRQVRDDVRAATNGKQEPYTYGSLGGGMVPIMPGRSAAPASPAAIVDSQQAEFEATMSVGTVASLDSFLTKYPSGPLANIARRERERLKEAAARPSPPPSWATPLNPTVTPAGSQTQVAMAPPVSSPLATGGLCGGVKLASVSSRAASPLSANEECALEAKAEFQECENCPTMVVVPAGSFTMGSSSGEKYRGDDEGPQHEVMISRPFAVGKFEVSFDEWDACVADGGCGGYKPKDEGWGRGRMPAIHVSWYDAQAYAAWLSKRTGKAYRLLSEAEWEYAARGGTKTPFWWGSSISTRQANYDVNYSYYGGGIGEYRGQTVVVDSFAPNAFGLYNVHGNVEEWVEDCFHDSYKGAPMDGSAWTTGDCSTRILRGGSWDYDPRSLRVASRDRNYPDVRKNGAGFRLARMLAP